MKAIVLKQYGPPEKVLKLENISKPIPKADEVLVKIHASTINDYEWSLVRGRPKLYQLLFGIGKPKWKIPGMEYSGTIEALGENVESFKVGDPVYGDTSEFGFGTLAEFFCVNEKALNHKPASMSFEEAASIPHASMLAYQGLVEEGNIKEGAKVLINGAGGGVGTFGLQIAKQYSAEVTGVDTGEKLEMMKSMGFDHIIDYKAEDFTKNKQTYDLILDAKSTRSPFSLLVSLNKNGIYATVGGTPGKLLQMAIFGKIINLTSSRKIKIVALKPNKDLDYINQLHTQGKITCVIDGPYPLEDVPRLITYFGEGKHSGKIVILPGM